MFITIDLDDELVQKAELFTGIKDTTALVHEALASLVSSEAARRLAALGGSDPNAKAPPRRKPGTLR